MPDLTGLMHTEFLTYLAVVPRGFAADYSSRMPQPRETRCLGTGEMSQTQVLADAANDEKKPQDEYDGLQAP